MPGDYLTTGEAAKLLGVNPVTIIRYTATGKLPVVRLPSGHRRIPREAVEKLLREGQR